MKSFKIVFTAFFPQTSVNKRCQGVFTGAFCPLLLPCGTELWKTTWVRMGWFTLALKATPNICFSWNQSVIVCHSASEMESQLQSKWILYIFLSLSNYFLDLIPFQLALSLYSFSSSALCSIFFATALASFLSFQFSQVLTSIAFGEICCHLEQHPSLFESTNQTSRWLHSLLYLVDPSECIPKHAATVIT